MGCCGALTCDASCCLHRIHSKICLLSVKGRPKRSALGLQHKHATLQTMSHEQPAAVGRTSSFVAQMSSNPLAGHSRNSTVDSKEPVQHDREDLNPRNFTKFPS